MESKIVRSLATSHVLYFNESINVMRTEIQTIKTANNEPKSVLLLIIRLKD